ncbi:MAG: hypothetical protein WCN88_04705 [Candidatus Falkowbacteria bacterium]
MDISLNHVGVLRSVLTDKIYEEHFTNFDMSNLDDVLYSLSEAQYEYIKTLLRANGWFKLKQILNNAGLKNK